jgi:hypothetical protein
MSHFRHKVAERIRWKFFAFQMIWHARVNARFDAIYGVDTAAEAQLVSTGIPEADAAAGNSIYRPLWENVFDKVLRFISPLGLSRYHFVDLGSGKGKLLLLATKYPFRSIQGVEYSPGLNAIAQANIEAFKSRVMVTTPIESQLRDATVFEPPSGPCIVLVFNSFSDDMMSKVLDGLGRRIRDRDEPLFLIYVNVRDTRECPAALSGTPDLVPLVRRRKFVVLANRQGADIAPREWSGQKSYGDLFNWKLLTARRTNKVALRWQSRKNIPSGESSR